MMIPMALFDCYVEERQSHGDLGENYGVVSFWPHSQFYTGERIGWVSST